MQRCLHVVGSRAPSRRRNRSRCPTATGTPFLPLAAHAHLLALLFLRTNAAGNARQRVGAEQQLPPRRFRSSASKSASMNAGMSMPTGQPSMHLPSLDNADSDRPPASTTAILFDESEIDLLEIVVPLVRVSFRHVLPIDLHPLFRRHRHRNVSRGITPRGSRAFAYHGRRVFARNEQRTLIIPSADERAGPALRHDGRRIELYFAARYPACIRCSASSPSTMRSCPRYAVSRSLSSAKSTSCPSNSGPSTQAKSVAAADRHTASAAHARSRRP